MGAWGPGNFENDAAQDWLYDFGENDFRLIDRTLAGVAAMIEADELDAWEAQEVLAAAECVAAAAGFPPDNPLQELAEWLAENSPMPSNRSTSRWPAGPSPVCWPSRNCEKCGWKVRNLVGGKRPSSTSNPASTKSVWRSEDHQMRTAFKQSVLADANFSIGVDNHGYE